MRDEHGRACHKTCAETELAAKATALAAKGKTQMLGDT